MRYAPIRARNTTRVSYIVRERAAVTVMEKVQEVRSKPTYFEWRLWSFQFDLPCPVHQSSRKGPRLWRGSIMIVTRLEVKVGKSNLRVQKFFTAACPNREIPAHALMFVQTTASIAWTCHDTIVSKHCGTRAPWRLCEHAQCAAIPESRYIPDFFRFLAFFGPQTLFIFLCFYSLVYSIYVETMYYSYLSVCPVPGTTISYLILLIWFQQFIRGEYSLFNLGLIMQTTVSQQDGFWWYKAESGWYHQDPPFDLARIQS